MSGVNFGGGKFYAVCERCEKHPALPTEGYCEECTQNMAEAQYERQQEGECFRGNEAAAFMAEEQERARRLK